MKIKDIISGLNGENELMLFDPGTGATRTRESLNDTDRTFFDVHAEAAARLEQYAGYEALLSQVVTWAVETASELSAAYENLRGMGFTPEQIERFGFPEPIEKNTLIEFLYRDASNYKKYNQAVVRGEITKEQIETIQDCLFDGEQFIPGQVGLEGERFSDITEDDTPWFELYPKSGITLTDIRDNTGMTVEELVEKFKAAKGNWKPEEYA